MIRLFKNSINNANEWDERVRHTFNKTSLFAFILSEADCHRSSTDNCMGSTKWVFDTNIHVKMESLGLIGNFSFRIWDTVYQRMKIEIVGNHFILFNISPWPYSKHCCSPQKYPNPVVATICCATLLKVLHAQTAF